MNEDDSENKIIGDDLIDDDDEELLASVDDAELHARMAICRVNNGGPLSPRARMEQEKRLRREIANSNERRRMQSINSGFQTLKALLPRRDGEKMSKASILQQTSDFITQLQQEKHHLMQKIVQYKIVIEVNGLKTPILQDTLQSSIPTVIPNVVVENLAPSKKRRRFEQSSDSSDEGVGMMSDVEPRVPDVKSYSTATVQTEHANPPEMVQDKLWEIELLQRQLIEIRLALDRERRMRLMFETQLRNVELSRLQSLTRLTGVNLLEFPSLVSAVTCGSSLLDTSIPANQNPSPQPKVQSPGLLSPSTVPKYPTAASSSTTTIATPFANPFGGSPFFPSNSSKQSLEAIVEAIRHLEGDQLFVDVDCRSAGQTQNILQRYQQNDSGISSPVSERPYHLPSSNDVANAVLQTFYQQARHQGAAPTRSAD